MAAITDSNTKIDPFYFYGIEIRDGRLQAPNLQIQRQHLFRSDLSDQDLVPYSPTYAQRLSLKPDLSWNVLTINFLNEIKKVREPFIRFFGTNLIVDTPLVHLGQVPDELIYNVTLPLPTTLLPNSQDDLIELHRIIFQKKPAVINGSRAYPDRTYNSRVQIDGHVEIHDTSPTATDALITGIYFMLQEQFPKLEAKYKAMMADKTFADFLQTYVLSETEAEDPLSDNDTRLAQELEALHDDYHEALAWKAAEEHVVKAWTDEGKLFDASEVANHRPTAIHSSPKRFAKAWRLPSAPLVSQLHRPYRMMW